MSVDTDQETTLHLIDAADGRLLQSWAFALACITIGRGEQASIALSDPYVSRLHAEIIRESAGWVLHSRGRNGVFLEGRRIEQCPLVDGTVFRLGPTGPMFQFGKVEPSTGNSTLSVDPDAVILLALDRSEVERQADVLAETDYFQQLQAKARELRRKRTTSDHPALE